MRIFVARLVTPLVIFLLPDKDRYCRPPGELRDPGGLVARFNASIGAMLIRT